MDSKLNTNEILNKLNIDCSNNYLVQTRYSVFEFSQQLEYYSIDKLLEKLKTFNNLIYYAYITHDKDINKDLTPVKAHFHAIIKLKNALPLILIINKLDTTPEHIERIKRFDSAIAYLLHRNAPDKYQYDISELFTNYQEKEIKSFIDSALKPLNDKELLDKFLIDYMNLKYNRIELESLLNVSIQLKYKHLIDNATKIRTDKAMREIDRNIQVFYICGCSGIGKTTLAKYLIIKKYGKENISISATGKNIFDNYQGQRAFILDDFIPNNENITYKDFLKILDNNTNSPVASRYFNKSLFDLKDFYITSCELPYNYFDYRDIKGDNSQFYRRLNFKYFLIEYANNKKDYRNIYLCAFNYDNGKLDENKQLLKDLTAEFNEYLQELFKNENDNIF